MSKIQNWVQSLIPDAQGVLRRFPLAALMVALFTIVIVLEANGADFDSEMMMRLVGGTALAGYLAVIVTLAGEGRGKPVAIWIKAVMCIGVMIVSYFYNALAFIPPIAIGASILFVGSSLFWRQKRDDVAVWDFTHKIWTAVIFTVAGSILYTIGLFSIAGALKSLFGLNIRSFISDWCIPIGLGFLAPMAWMSMIPRLGEADDGDSLRNPNFISRAVGFLGTWILAPLTLVYAAILIAYGVKIIMTQSLPEGEIAKLVTPFLIIGTLTWLILDPPFIQEKRLARWYHKFWFPLMIPAAILLAVAVFVRISAYGWTIERYLLVLASVWALGIGFWFAFGGEARRDIRIIPGFAALLLALASIGPWGADGFSLINQSARLERALSANAMLDASGKLVLKDTIELNDEDAAKHAKGALSYLIRRNKKAAITQYFDGDISALTYETDSKKLDRKKIIERFGLENTQLYSKRNHHYRSYQRVNRDNLPIIISGYDFMIQSRHANYQQDARAFHENYKFGDYEILSEKQDLVLRRGKEELVRKNMVEWLKSQPVGDMDTINLDPYLPLYQSGDISIVLYIANAALYGADTKNKNVNMQYMVLVKGVELKDED